MDKTKQILTDFKQQVKDGTDDIDKTTEEIEKPQPMSDFNKSLLVVIENKGT